LVYLHLLILRFLILLIIFLTYNFAIAMENKPYHHLADGTFRNPKGSPERSSSFNWSFKIFNEEKKKIKIEIPEDHVVKKQKVLQDINNLSNGDYIAWIGHATFIIKLGNTTIITDPVFEKNMGPLIFGPKRFVDPAINLNEIPKIDLFLLTHNHYDHLSTRTINRFPFKKSKVLTPLELGKYFTRNGFKNVTEMDWYDEINFNDLKITFVPAVHWSKRSLWDTNKTLWGSFIIEYKNKKIFFACDTGYGNIYKDLGNKYGPIDLTLINIGAYNFYPMSPKKDYSIYHTNPEEALQIGKDLKSKKVLGMHWGTVILSLEPIFDPPKRFKANSSQYGYIPDDAIIMKIGQVEDLKSLI
jgi:N-acyl-phosphatidylethanolamine-hydrolysing phospholipase D